MRTSLVAALVVSVSALAVACGDSSEPPLGGPYGGTGNAPSPNHATASTTDATDPAATDDTSTSGRTTSDGDADDESDGESDDDADDVGTSSGGTSSGGTSSGGTSSSSGGTSSSSSSSGSTTSSAKTWTQLYTAYFAAGTVGDCANCHGKMSTASAAYSWLKGKGQINGASSKLSSTTSSSLSWLGGDMPPNGPSSNAAAKADVAAWVAAGAPNN